MKIPQIGQSLSQISKQQNQHSTQSNHHFRQFFTIISGIQSIKYLKFLLLFSDIQILQVIQTPQLLSMSHSPPTTSDSKNKNPIHQSQTIIQNHQKPNQVSQILNPLLQLKKQQKLISSLKFKLDQTQGFLKMQELLNQNLQRVVLAQKKQIFCLAAKIDHLRKKQDPIQSDAAPYDPNSQIQDSPQLLQNLKENLQNLKEQLNEIKNQHIEATEEFLIMKKNLQIQCQILDELSKKTKKSKKWEQKMEQQVNEVKGQMGMQQSFLLLSMEEKAQPLDGLGYEMKKEEEEQSEEEQTNKLKKYMHSLLHGQIQKSGCQMKMKMQQESIHLELFSVPKQQMGWLSEEDADEEYEEQTKLGNSISEDSEQI